MAPDDVVQILLAEDSPADVRLTRYALEQARMAVDLHVASDGVEALEFLRREGRFVGAPRPDFVLLDLNMPRMSGQEVLEVMKADADLSTIPVIVLTTSSAPDDVARSYQLHVNCYVRKPIAFDQFLEVMRSIEEFWLRTVELPRV
jgi:CheY-like chemotaxis protein